MGCYNNTYIDYTVHIRVKKKSKTKNRTLTDNIRKQQCQRYCNCCSTQGRTFPVTAPVGFIKCEGRPGEGAPGQRSWRG